MRFQDLGTVFFYLDYDHSNVTAQTLTAIYKDWNSFQHAMSIPYDLNKETEWQIHIGSKMFPGYPCRSVNQSFYELKKVLGIARSTYHNISPTGQQYQDDHFICAVDTEKVIEAGFTGLNTKQSDLMTTRCKPANSPPPNQVFF